MLNESEWYIVLWYGWIEVLDGVRGREREACRGD